MMKNKLISVFILMGILAQFAVFSAIIIRRELTLHYGDVCRFETAPVDPFDAFRGQYVQLDYKAFNPGILSDRSFNTSTWCYLILATDTNNFSIVSSISNLKPASGTFIRSRVKWSNAEYVEKPKPNNKYNREATGKWRIYFELPFSRYYMPEKLAPQAEHAYREANRRTAKAEKQAAARVRIWRGMVVIEDVEIDGKPIRECILDHKESQP
jgi:uncharacterized membrane-anchored protein